MNTSTTFSVGDRVVITPANLQTITTYNKNRCSGISWVSDAFYEAAKLAQGAMGTVTHIFPPSHDTTVAFPTGNLHMRSMFVTRALEMHQEYAIVFPGFFKRSEVEPGGSLYGFFRVVNMATGSESTLYSLEECREIVKNAQSGKLLGSFDA